MATMFALSKQEIKQRDEIITKLVDARETLDAKMDAANAFIKSASDAIESAVSAYNKCLSATQEFIQDIVSQADNDIGEKSEKWQEGDRGQAADAWKTEWESSVDEISDVVCDVPAEITLDIPDHAELLQNLPECAERCVTNSCRRKLCETEQSAVTRA